MATLYCTTGVDTGPKHEVCLHDVESRLWSKGYSARDVVYTPQAPQFNPALGWPGYAVLQVYDNEPKAMMFPKSGFYHLRGLDERSAKFLLEPEK